MKSVEKGRQIPIGEIPAVQELVDLKMEIDTLKAEHPDVFMRYQDLADRYNAKLEEAEKIVRTDGVSCGPFKNFSVAVKYNAEKMFEELGEEMFLKNGGAITKRAVYTVDEKSAEAAIAGGSIPDECVDNFREVRRNYHKPGKITV